jgi:Fe-S-cluster containining protein
MEFTLDIALVRDILVRERARVSDDIRQGGVLQAFAQSRPRHDARIAAAADLGTLACRAGCSFCCHFTVDVRPAEVFGILDYIDRSFGDAARARALAAVQANSASLAGLSGEERATRNVRCPFLDDGRCSIYPVRPQSCRNYHATYAAGCEQSWEEPGNLDIDPEFAPGVYQAGEAHVEAVSGAMADAGYDVGAYELSGALAAALADAAARTRFEAGLKPFTGLRGDEVPAEFDDLGYP